MHRNPHELVEVFQGEKQKNIQNERRHGYTLSNLKITMCHVFICDEIQMLTIVTFDTNSSKGDNVKVTITRAKLILDSPLK